MDAGWHGFLMARMLGVHLRVYVVPSAEQMMDVAGGWSTYHYNARLAVPADKTANMVRTMFSTCAFA